MNITKVQTYAVEIPVKPELQITSSLGQHTISRYVIVRITTDNGIEGVGEATVMPRWSGETVWGCKALIDNVYAPLLVGCDPHDIAEIDHRMEKAAADNWFAKSAVEMACWDIQGKEAGKPVYELLGGAVRDRKIRCRFSMSAYKPDRARQRAQELIDAGFTTIKIKVTGDVPSDVERVQAVREVIGPKIPIVIDANCGYQADGAIEAGQKMADLNVVLFEQPTPQGDFAGMAKVRQNIGFEVMADDAVFDMHDAVNCVRADACQVISVYPGKNGGISRTKAIVDYCEQNGIACSMGSNLEWDLATAAMCHLVVACKNLQIEKYPGDILGPSYHAFSIAKNPIVIDGPFVTVTDRPGLGVDVDWNVVEKNLFIK
ncbi:MAG: mandelate racemase/muconate lactonizing enzyme family protein [Planctomycetota bacterium]|nr:mandelate racemase/muconate lactonizing enzyme family protein [Planctomycetota bacterium]MDA1214477.1 mandelate racemase/muconate lactonizing enzyme family protein [Planctomycetota bacterium]